MLGMLNRSADIEISSFNIPKVSTKSYRRIMKIVNHLKRQKKVKERRKKETFDLKETQGLIQQMAPATTIAIKVRRVAVRASRARMRVVALHLSVITTQMTLKNLNRIVTTRQGLLNRETNSIQQKEMMGRSNRSLTMRREIIQATYLSSNQLLSIIKITM